MREKKRSDMELLLTHLRENGIQDTGHPVFKSVSALSRGILKKKNGRDATHFHADASNTELSFQIIFILLCRSFLRTSYELV